MTLDIPTSPILEPQLYEDWDDEDDVRWKAPLDAVIKGDQTPLHGAQQIDQMLRVETTTRLQKLKDYSRTHLTAEDTESSDWGGLYPPNATAFAKELLQSWCRVCTAYAPYSEGQNRLIDFLNQLRQLPRWMAPETRPDENGHVVESEFWAFGHGWIGLEDEFRRLHAGIKPNSNGDPAAHKRWRNFQHAMARVTAIQLIYCAPFNALSDLMPSTEPHGKPNLECDINAAAQWVAWPLECRYVYKECSKKDITNDWWNPWSKQGWKQWKAEFGRVSESKDYDERTRAVARKAARCMSETEEEVDKEGSV